MTTTKSPDSTAVRRFFGRRKGHRLRAYQAELIETLLPRLALDLGEPAPDAIGSLFAVPVREVRLEIGFGGGEYLVAEAGCHPHTGFLGCEPFVNGMAKALAAIEAQGSGNVRLHLGDAVPVLSWLPPASSVRRSPSTVRSRAAKPAVSRSAPSGSSTSGLRGSTSR